MGFPVRTRWSSRGGRPTGLNHLEETNRQREGKQEFEGTFELQSSIPNSPKCISGLEEREKALWP